MAGAWSCPHEADDICTRVGHQACQPGMRGCVLFRRYSFFDGDSQYPAQTRAREDQADKLPFDRPDSEKGS